MKRVECTTPFGQNLDNICTDKTKSMIAYDIYRKISLNSSCLKPCTFLSGFSKASNSHEAATLKDRKIMIKLKQLIRKNKAFITYNGSDMFAAIGGYVGLFLGFSIFHISEAFSFVIKKVNNQ